MRVDKFLSNMGIGTRSQIGKEIARKNILVNNEIVKTASFHINPDSDIVKFKGKEIFYKKNIYLMLNKPAGVISAREDRKEKTVIDLIKSKYRINNVSPMGRLDKDTVGLLILTDDGELIHRVLNPKKHISKTYYAKVMGEINLEDKKAFKEGIDINGEYTTKSSELVILKSGDISEIEITIFEGKYHQVKRMFLARGKKVIYLKRIKMGNLYLDESLKEGEVRELSKEEISLLLI